MLCHTHASTKCYRITLQVATQPLLSRGPGGESGRNQNGYKTPAILGPAKQGYKKTLHNPCRFRSSKMGRNQTGYTTQPVSGPTDWSSKGRLDNLCCLWVRKAQRDQTGYKTPAILGPAKQGYKKTPPNTRLSGSLQSGEKPKWLSSPYRFSAREAECKEMLYNPCHLGVLKEGKRDYIILAVLESAKGQNMKWLHNACCLKEMGPTMSGARKMRI